MLNIFISILSALVISPLLSGIIKKTKAAFAGRKGAPLLQLYYDLAKLFRKGFVISSVTSSVFFISPVIIFTVTAISAVFIPVASTLKAVSFTGDFILLFYLLAFGRFFMIISALDTGSSFEGMGASREAFFSSLSEPAAFISVITILRIQDTTVFADALVKAYTGNPVIMILAVIPLFIVMLAENARIPFDDPETHLELTMIHEVMILDNSGPDLALYEYASAVKMWVFSLIIARAVMTLLPVPPIAEPFILIFFIFLVAAAAGVVESVLARASLLKVPKLIFSAGTAAFLGFFLSFSKVLG